MYKSTSLFLSLAAAASAAPNATNGSHWSSWQDVRQMFVFGDSYTQTGFNVTGVQPNPSNPFGNPPYPGWTSSNGPNWIDFLATTYNQSIIYTYNLAYGGATVDAELVEPYTPTVISMRDQIIDQYLPYYGSAANRTAEWDASTSLFAFFIGINDIGNSWWRPNATDIYNAIFAEWVDLVESVYDSGARNFLFLTVPPVNVSPLILTQPDPAYAIEEAGKAIVGWNERASKMAADFEASHEGVTTFVHDTWGLYNKVIENPDSVEQTKGTKNVTVYCEAYKNGTPDWYTKDASCEYAVNEYLWLNELHPTFPMHNATAASIAKLLTS